MNISNKNGLYRILLGLSSNNMTDDIEKIYNSKCSENDKQNKEQKLFDRYIGENSQKFIEEFNSRMEKYNVYFIQINIKEQ